MSKKIVLMVLMCILLISPSFAYYTAWRGLFLSCDRDKCYFKYNFDIQEDYPSIKLSMDKCSNGCELKEDYLQCSYKETDVIYKDGIYEINIDYQPPETIAKCIDSQYANNKPCNTKISSADFLIFSTRLCLSQTSINKCDISYWYTPRFVIEESKKFTAMYNFSYYDDNLKEEITVFYQISPIDLPCGKGSKIISNNTLPLKNFLITYSKENKWLVDNYLYTQFVLSKENDKEL